MSGNIFVSLPWLPQLPVREISFVRSLFLLAICLLLLPAARTCAQTAVSIRGVTWQAPSDYEQAARDLEKIRETGFNAVRTGVITDGRLLTLADTLGIAVYQELPLHYLSSERLRDTLNSASETLATLLVRSRSHSSARDVGILRYGETSDTLTCDAVRQLVESGRRAAAPGTRFYYVSLFPTDDVCDDAVDFVLLDARDTANPADLLRRWYENHETPAGLAAVGTWTARDATPGLRNWRSPQQQARYLEDRLREILIDASVPGLTGFFVYRWRDAEIKLPSITRADVDPYRATYGLHTATMEERPAYEVVRGMLTGRQMTFAFAAGDVSVQEWPWQVIATWLALVLIGLVYTLSTRVRHMVPRYFRAHGFYRDAIREGRDLLLGSSAILLVAVSIAGGIIFSAGVEAIGDLMAFRIILAWLPENFVRAMASVTARPEMFLLFASAVYAALILLWVIFITAFSRLRYALGAGQVLMLVLWPRWPLIILMLAAVAAATRPVETLDQALPILIIWALWILVSLYASVRTLVDFTATSRVPIYVPLVLFFLNPLVLGLIAGTFAIIQYQPDVLFALRVATAG